MSNALSLDDEEPTALSLDDDEAPPQWALRIKLDPSSMYAKMPAGELQGLVITSTFKVTDVTDFDAGCDPSNPNLPAYRVITVIEV